MIDIPDFKPPRLTPQEHLRRLYEQLEGLKTWEDGSDKAQMWAYVQAQIVKWTQAVELTRC